MISMIGIIKQTHPSFVSSTQRVKHNCGFTFTKPNLALKYPITDLVGSTLAYKLESHSAILNPNCMWSTPKQLWPNAFWHRPMTRDTTPSIGAPSPTSGCTTDWLCQKLHHNPISFCNLLSIESMTTLAINTHQDTLVINFHSMWCNNIITYQ